MLKNPQPRVAYDRERGKDQQLPRTSLIISVFPPHRPLTSRLSFLFPPPCLSQLFTRSGCGPYAALSLTGDERRYLIANKVQLVEELLTGERRPERFDIIDILLHLTKVRAGELQRFGHVALATGELDDSKALQSEDIPP